MFISDSRVDVNSCIFFLEIYVYTLESGINVALRLLIFWLFSKGYGLIPDSIDPILVV